VHIWDGANIVGDVDNGTVSAMYVRGIGLVSSKNGGVFEYYLFNGHGDVVQHGSTTYEYDAFGVEKSPDENDANPFRYCGEYWDSETGTVYLRARYYSPRLGRFTTEDPVGDGLNWYTYCSGDPVGFVDPWGLVEVNLFEYAQTYEGCTIEYTYMRDSESYYTLIYNGKWFRVYWESLFTGTDWCIDDSLFVDAFGVGTNTIVVYQDSTTGNVSIRAAFEFSGDARNNVLDGVAYWRLFLNGIIEGWSNNTTSVYAVGQVGGIKVNIVDGAGTSYVSNFWFDTFVEAFWSPSNPGNIHKV